jgi:hypothetical protein
MAFYLMLVPTGAALSLDRWRRARDRFWEFPARAPWALRLIQIQISVVYVTSVWSKMQGDTWNSGTAVYYAIGVQDVQRFPVPSFVLHNVLIINLLTYGTLALEASIAVLVWNKKARPYVLLMGVALHLAMDYALLITFFSYIVIVSYTAFVSPQWVEARVRWLRNRSSRAPHPDPGREWRVEAKAPPTPQLPPSPARRAHRRTHGVSVH